ncbi:hypothetical protein [Mangrovitalea sediminis]|uniref:hypothetical protein n=1 Tax=Mangrovitalea sediminis TaxID=1982043 RepID=UPI000BE62539|nr:hypothetical protein [Mangrovitalea sediminis]
MFNQENIEELLDQLDGSGSDREFNAVNELRKLDNELPKLLLEKYKLSKRWPVRSSCVYHAIRYARSSMESVQLGREALFDKSKVVRYRACMLLACALDESTMVNLKEALDTTKDPETIADIEAAIDAVKNRNSDYFVDRKHSGKIKLKVN